MRDWATIAKAQGLNLPARDVEKAARALAELQQTFEPITADLPPELEPAFEYRPEDE